MVYNLTFVLRSLFFFFLKINFGLKLGCVLYTGVHYTWVHG